eukprot:Hpha_TRINITY_DN8175_c0_g1::TRINITY_DN8175_c0_g1_i1::g.171924::m.171924/K16601/TTLL4; tubulin polyglutamylase TTLL4
MAGMAAASARGAAAFAARCPSGGSFRQSYGAQPNRPTPYKIHPDSQESILFTRNDLGEEGRVMDTTNTLLFKTTNENYYAVRVPLLRAGFKRLPRDSLQQCNIIWRRPFSLTSTSDTEIDSSGAHAQSGALQPVRREQRTNHFPASYVHLGSKDGLWKCLEAMRIKFGEAFHITPRTWILPEEHTSLVEYLRSDAKTPLIVKPARGSCGREIFVCRSHDDERLQRLLSFATAPAPQPLPDVPRARMRQRRWVVQEFLDPPMLISGRKYDLRLYVSVTSADPLVAYVYKEGLVRFASEPYSSGTESTRFADLTNSSVARKRDALLRKKEVDGAPDAEPDPALVANLEPAPAPPPLPRPLQQWQVWSRGVGEAPSSDDDPSWPRFKWTLSELRQHIVDEHGEARWEQVWEGVCAVVRRTLIAAQKPISAHMAKHPSGPIYRERSFEHFGFDIMLGEDMRPWLIEVNCLPSLESSSAMDWSVKCGSVTDLFNMLQIQPFERDADDMRMRAIVDDARAARKDAERDLEQLERTANEEAEEEPELPALREKVARLRQEEDQALAAFRAAGHGSVPCEPPAEWTPEAHADRLEVEQAHRGGYQRIFPTAATVKSDAEFFSTSASNHRNNALWKSMRLA